jgi:hypothetical protein
VIAHRARGFGRYVALRRATPRHHHTDEQDVSDRRPLLILLAIVVAVVAGTVTATARWSPDARPRAAVTPPAASVPPPVTVTPSFRSGLAAARAVPRGAKATAVLLGPDGAEALASALTTFCRDGTAVVIDGDWTCGGAPIDMDEACACLYDDDAWAGMLNDDDPRSWRCYRDVS